MIRWFLRSIIVSYISVYAALVVVGGWEFGDNRKQTLGLIIIAMALLHMFIIPIFRVMGLPNKGIPFLFLKFALTAVLLYILPMFVGSFSIVETELAQLRIFGFVLPSRHLTPTAAVVYSGLVVSLVYHFFEWLFDKK